MNRITKLRREILDAMPKLALSLILIAIIAISAPAWAQTGDGTVTVVTGGVVVVHNGISNQAAVGTAVFDGDEVDTAAASSATVTLADKSTLEIGELSKVKLDIPHLGAANSADRITLLAGVLRSYVAHAASAGAPTYEVHTPNAVAAARGTKYDVSYQEGVDRKQFEGCHRFTDVAVYDGVVDVANVSAPGNTVELHPGYKSIVPCALLPTAAAAIAAAAGGASSLGTAATAAGAVAAVGGGVVGGVAASGGFSSSNKNASPSR
jgi:ferric-dicitrate binding protein FerR (iron transport regulator)